MMQVTGIMGAVSAIVFISLVVCGGYAVYRIKQKVRRISRAAFGTDSLAEGLEKQADLLAETPKSVMGMTNVYLPQIAKDFPEFHWPEFKQKCENTLRSYLTALEQEDISYLEDASAELRKQAELQIEANRSSGQRECYRQVMIHRTEIARYMKQEGLCIVKIQSALEYYHDIGSETARRKEQNRYNLEMVYVQDASKVKDGADAIGLNCPNCGAPITRLGSKFCEYCGSGVIPVNDKVWMLHRIEKEV